MKRILLYLIIPIFINCSNNDDSDEECLCTIKGTKQISFDNGVTWEYSGLDGRSGMKFPCYYDEIATNQETNQSNGVMYRIYWECQD